jgi:polygalacturonase
MFSILKICLSILVCLIGGSFSNAALNLRPVAHAPNIIRITSDSLILVSGFTRQFSVDSPEDQGPVSTGITVSQLAEQLIVNSFSVYRSDKTLKTEGELQAGDVLHVSEGKSERNYIIGVQPMALRGKLVLHRDTIRANSSCDLTLDFTAGQRSPQTNIEIQIPSGVNVTMDNTTVNVIGRGEVKLSELAAQSIGRTGTNYSYKQVGQVKIIDKGKQGQIVSFSNIDLRPLNGIDLRIRIRQLNIQNVGDYVFMAFYTTTEPGIYRSPAAEAHLTVVSTIVDFTRQAMRVAAYRETADSYTTASFHWTPALKASKVTLVQSIDKGKKWTPVSAVISPDEESVAIKNLKPNTLYGFKLKVKGGENEGESNTAYFYSGKLDIKQLGAIADGTHDNTQQINEAIEYIHRLGGGTLHFIEGIFSVRTVHLKSNVYLYIEKSATIKTLKGADAEELTWFSDKKYRSGLSPTDTGPYNDPENYLTKQDVGHTFFRNAMFFGERLDNVKIIGNGRITGDGNLVTGDKVMNNPPENRADKMFSFKLCTNIEIGGIAREADLWYDPEKDEPYYIGKNGFKDFDCGNMLNIDRGGHFVLLATGTDSIFVHNTYFGKFNTSNVRDIYDFMGCNEVTVTNIYCKVSSDDIVKPGSDCSLGFTRPAKNYKVRNIIGDTNCNLFQIGSETADDITDVCVDNIYVLGANKAGFSISTNDGGHVKNIHLNCGHTGTLHSRSKMYRTTTPFFISISNRGRVLGANVARYRFKEKGNAYDELLCTNVNIGEVENIILNGVDVFEVYGGSSFRGGRWKAYDGTQRKASPIVAGYKLPDSGVTEGGLNFKLPNGKHTGYITNIVFNDIHVLAKGGNALEDSKISPRELGVGQYNVSNLGIQPSYGLWARHAKDLHLENCSFNFEKRDSRFAIVLDDVVGAKIDSVKMVKAEDNDHVIKLLNSTDVTVRNTIYYRDVWGQSPAVLPSGMIKTSLVP